MPTANELIGPHVVDALAAAMSAAAPEVDIAAMREHRDELDGLTLRERSDLLKNDLHTALPGSFRDFETVVRTALVDSDFKGWLIWPVSEAVAERALNEATEEAFDGALALLADLTPRLTAEFAIHPLLEANLARALPIVQTWTSSADPHLRRLASEGTRPALPWAKRVKAILADPEITLPILEALRHDDSLYVRRSVANHLKDISWRNPDLVVATAERWLHNDDANTQWIVRHGLRALVKRGHPGALALIGAPPTKDVVVTGPVLEIDTVAVGDSLPFHVTLENTARLPVKVVVDYIVHHQKANGRQSSKVFKLKTLTLAAEESATLHKQHSFKVVTTRTYFPGSHALEVQVNGVVLGRTTFELTAAPQV